MAIDGIDTHGIETTWLDGTLDGFVDLFDKLDDCLAWLDGTLDGFVDLFEKLDD